MHHYISTHHSVLIATHIYTSRPIITHFSTKSITHSHTSPLHHTIHLSPVTEHTTPLHSHSSLMTTHFCVSVDLVDNTHLFDYMCSVMLCFVLFPILLPLISIYPLSCIILVPNALYFCNGTSFCIVGLYGEGINHIKSRLQMQLRGS